MIIKNCLFCKKEYRARKTAQIFCSFECFGKKQKGKKLSEEHKKNLSLSLIGRISPNKGKNLSTKHRKKLSLSHLGQKAWNKNKKVPQITGPKHFAWKENPKYRALHSWVERTLGKPEKCENCQKNGLSGHHIHWANISQEYKRNLSDWIRLCVKCHKAFDRTENQLILQ